MKIDKPHIYEVDNESMGAAYHDMLEIRIHDFFVPPAFWNLSVENLAAYTRGCGPGLVGDLVVPDRILGLDMRPVCRVHDACYSIFEDTVSQDEADRMMLENGRIYIDKKSGNCVSRFIRMRIWKRFYYGAVHIGGEVFR